jgi:hypothetical protein
MPGYNNNDNNETVLTLILKILDEASPVLKKLKESLSPLEKGIGDANNALGSLKASFVVTAGIVLSILSVIAAVVSLYTTDKAFKDVESNLNKLKDLMKNLKGETNSIKTSLSGLDEKLNKVFEAFPNKRAQALKAAMAIRDVFQRTYEGVKVDSGRGFLDLDDLAKTLQDALDKLGDSLNVDIPKLSSESLSSIEQDVNAMKEQFSSLDPQLDKQLTIDTTDVPFAVASVQSYLDSIPDVTVKKVIVQMYTQASPVRPFGEGMAHVRRELESLPQGQDFTLKFNRRSAQLPAGLYSGGGGGAPATTAAGASFAPVININGAQGGGREMARDLDRELARLWRTRRSHLREAMDHA